MRERKQGTGPESSVVSQPGGAAGIPEEPQVTGATTQRMLGLREQRPDVPVKRYRVIADKMVVFGGCRTKLAAGKEISEAQYDVMFLKRQGVRLEPLADEDAPQ